MLTYTKTKTTTQPITVRAPRSWSCYTPKGDRALRQKAERLVAKVERLVEQDRWGSQEKVKAALVSFIASWMRMSRSATYRSDGISDTAVREVVADFHDEIVAATYGRGRCDDREWENHYEDAYYRVNKPGA